MKWILRLFVLLIVLAVVTAGGTYIYVMQWFGSDGPLQEDVIVYIEPGTGFRQITNQLVEAKVLDQDLLFKAMAYKRNEISKVKAGEYKFEARVSPKDVLETLVKGESVAYAVTVPEGLTVKEVQLLLMSDTRLTGPIPLGLQEGDLMPDTYFIHRGDTRASVVKRMQQSMQTFLEEQWAARQAGLPLKNKQEALVLASMIEKETGVDGERGRVAAVFVNRLNKGMLLQSDPTVVYGIELKDGPMGRPLWLKDLKIDHPYNTYVHAGLPPKPIANPGKQAIEAALNPPKTNEFYFVATGSGGHFFSRTLAEHNRNVAKYRAVLRSQKAKP